MARAVLFHGPGRPLEPIRLPDPEPRGGEVVVRTIGCTLCRSDLHTHAGRRGGPTPSVLGHEIVGAVAAFGPQAPRADAAGLPLAVGDRVTWAVAVGCGRCFFCADDLPQKCERPFKYGHERVSPDRPFAGGLADHVVLVAGTSLFRVPDAVADAVAAPANCATATVAAALRYAGPVAGRAVLVLGAGVLGLTACAMARAGGARAVLASDPKADARERARTFGATGTASIEAGERAALVADATAGRGADVVLELAGVAASVEAALTLARTGGTVVLVGSVAPTPPVALDPETVVRRMLTLRGVHNYHPRDLGAALAFLAAAGRAFPFARLIAATYPLDQAEQALAAAHARPGVRVLVSGTPEEQP